MLKGYSKFALLFFITAVVLRFIMLFSSFSFGTIAFCICVIAGIAMLGVDTLPCKEYAKAFDFEKKFGLTIFSALVSVGFFADFLCSGISLARLLESSIYNKKNAFFTLAVGACIDILCCFYYIIISFSYSGGSYDFRQLKLFHFVPLLWMVFQVLSVLSDVLNLSGNADGIITIAARGTGILALYYFIGEIDSKGGAKGTSVFFFRCFGSISILHFLSCLMLLLSGKIEIHDGDFSSSLVFLFLGIFMCFFEKSIISRTRIH